MTCIGSMATQTAPYGKWESAITPDSIVQSSITFTDVFVDPMTDRIYHVEARPQDKARCVIVDTLSLQDIIPSPYSARTGVHEYGGAAAIAYNGAIYFSNIVDNRVYSINLMTKMMTPRAVTPKNPRYRYTNFAVHPGRQDLVVAVLEDHTIDVPHAIVTKLVVINTIRTAVFPLATGADFYAAPVFNPSGTKVAWQEWYHPDMPWDGSMIYIADVLVQEDTLVVLNQIRVSGERLTKSVNYPRWASNTTLVFTSDELNGFQNPFIYSTLTGSARLAVPEPVQEDFGQLLWFLGNFPYALLDDPRGGSGKLAAFTAFRDGRSVLYIVNLSDDKEIVEIRDFPFVLADQFNQQGGKSIIFNGRKSDGPGGIFMCTFSCASFTPSYQILKSSAPQPIGGNEQYISPPRPITLYREGKPLYVVYYAPKNPKYSGSSIPGERPPCIVFAHAGPTGMHTQVLDWKKVYYTSRGYAWLDVNYGGSSGYGREYMSRLVGNWGIVDVQDCHDAPKLLAAPPYSLIDSTRVAIRGESAGAFTTLASVSIASDPGFFKAATSSYGICDLFSLSAALHKFQSKQLCRVLGGTLQEVPEVYATRSPANYTSKIVTPLLVLHGTEDKVILPEQSEQIVNAIISRGGEDRVKFRLYKGEGHGWRRAETIKEAVTLEHEWYDKHLLSERAGLHRVSLL